MAGVLTSGFNSLAGTDASTTGAMQNGDPILMARQLVEAPFKHSVDLLWLFAIIVFFGAALGLWGVVMSHLHMAME